MKADLCLCGLPRLLLVVGCLCVSPALAQLPDDAAAAQAERLIQEEQQRQQERAGAREERRQQPQSLLDEMPGPEQPKEVPGSDQCVQVNSIRLNGVSLFNESERHSMMASFINRCLTLNDINELLAAITNRYFERGYVTSRAYIPPQDLNDGELELVVIEGKIQSLDSDTLTPRAISQSFPTRASSLLNLRDLEQGIDQLNRLPSNGAALQLFPGDVPGMSRVRINNAPRVSAWRMFTNLDNSGQESTGERQFGVNYSLDDPFGLIDFVSIHLQTGAESSGQDDGTDSLALHYDLPLGYWNFDLDATAFEYKSRVRGATASFNTSGESENQSLRVSRLLRRDQFSKFGTRISLERKKNLNFIEDVLLETSSRTLASTGLEAWYQRNIRDGGWNVVLGYDKGIDALGAQDDDDHVSGEPKAEFDRLRLNARYYRRLTAGIPFSYSANLNGQYSNDVLYGIEQISIGSQYSVRGYKEQGVSGNKGAWLRQELSVPLPPSSGWLYDTLGSWEASLGLDWGKVRNLTPGQEPYTVLKGWGLGLRTWGGAWNLSVEWAKAMDPPAFLQPEDHDLYVSLAYAWRPEP